MRWSETAAAWKSLGHDAVREGEDVCNLQWEGGVSGLSVEAPVSLQSLGLYTLVNCVGPREPGSREVLPGFGGPGGPS